MKYREYIVEKTENKRLLIITDIHNCHANWYGMENDDRMELMCAALRREYDKAPYDAILCLGDYSLDFWGGELGGSYLWTPSVSRTTEFVEKYLPKFPTKSYMIPGNHEQYSDAKWKEITGFDREYTVVYGDFVFVMLDTFRGILDPTENGDGAYSGVNLELLEKALMEHPDKEIILCTHYFDPKSESEEVKKLIASEKRIRTVFAGHRHISTTVILDESWRNLPVVFCGNFSYHRLSKSTDYFGTVFRSFMSEEMGEWGYRILDLSDGNLSTDYMRVSKSE